MSFEEFLKRYSNLPDPQHHPEVVKYYIKLYKYEHERKQKE